ncbi:MAG: bifunctional glutamate N-acetyltransferase/amino-acid acetyltransferase ArgJ [Lachnospiraceae bacterium]|nr:bifunctional glutamate N-acetyltransferase/amino-acid acetyltransferase ArgJ [Lachnospiraceae bacterium]
MEKISGGVTAPTGFKAGAIEAGIKYENRKDLAILVSEKPCVTAGTFTTNVVKAAPVVWDRDIVKGNGISQAVVVNSGIANACTGEKGKKYCEETAETLANALNIPKSSVLIASTGVIGMQLKIDRIKVGIEAIIPRLSHELAAGHEAAEAIMTTDTHPKEFAVSFTLEDKEIRIGGMCKGSGMIHPNMCTMLSFLTTDISISRELLQEALSDSVKESYNMISVDGDTSTNDTCLLLANGMAGNAKILEKNDAYYCFLEALKKVNIELAKMMAGDGEGAKALFTVRVIHADTLDNARVLARSVVSSSLTKAAIFGHDANWGRILCALGYSGADFDPNNMELYLGTESEKLLLFANGEPVDYSEKEATRLLSGEEVTVTADMKMGDAAATAWGCDLTYDYVRINADYRS